MFLEQILRKQLAFQNSITGVQSAPVKAPAQLVSVQPSIAQVAPVSKPKPVKKAKTPALTDSGVFLLPGVVEAPAFDLSAFHKRYVLSKEDRAQLAKMVGVPAPLTMHERMVKYLESTKDDPNAPKSLKDLVLMCINHTLDAVDTETKKPV